MRWLTLLAAAAALGCEHPIATVTPHVEVADLVVRDASGTELARTVLNRSWSVDSLVLRDGTPLRIAIEALDFRGTPVAVAARTDLEYRVEAADPSLLAWEPLNGSGILRPFGRGTTRARVLIWHRDHADFVSPWLRVRILPVAAATSAGETTP